jgi:hypothetical protein
LLICTYAANGQRFADEAVSYLCEQPKRLKTGYSVCSGNSRAAKFWATKEIVEAITPHCSNENLERLESLILDYYPVWEKEFEYKNIRGYAQFILLDALAPSRRSKKADRRLQEWNRKFTSIELLKQPGKIEPPTTLESRLIGSPIPQDSADKMNNEQWLNALVTYDKESDFSVGNREFRGGADRLSFTLEECVKEEPVRFANLIWQFSDGINTAYFDAVLRGIAKATVKVDVETAFNVCQRCDRLPQKQCGREICFLIGDLADLPWSRQALDILARYALNDPDPTQELWRTEASSGQVYYDGDILTDGINTVRGVAASSIAKLIFSDKTRGAYFQNSLEQIVRDKSIAVRSCVAEALTAMLNYERDLAVSLFLELCNTEDILLGTTTVEWFLYYSTHSHFEALKPILERMIYSNVSQVVEVGARQACLTSLHTKEAHTLADYCLSRTITHRKAAVEIFVANLKSAHHRQYCENTLIKLFNDSEKDVRSQAARCFYKFEEDELKDYTNLIEKFVQSPAFETDSYDLIYALENTTAKLPETTYLVCDRFVQNMLAEQSQEREFGRDASTISELLVRLYSQTKDKKLQSQCLDLIDRLFEMSVYGLDKALHEYER